MDILDTLFEHGKLSILKDLYCVFSGQRLFRKGERMEYDKIGSPSHAVSSSRLP